MSSYGNVVKRKLSFKGDSKPVSSSSRTSAGKRKLEENGSSESKKKASIEEEEEKPFEIEIKLGTGRITSSGTTIHGQFTEFMSQLSVGDAIIITHPSTMQEETKIVRMVLSNISMGLSSAFSSDLITNTPFKFIKAPKDKEDEVEKERKIEEKKNRQEEEAFGTYASAGGSKFTYREKCKTAYGGYKVVTETTKGNLSREELLDMRSKKKADRHCY